MVHLPFQEGYINELKMADQMPVILRMCRPVSSGTKCSLCTISISKSQCNVHLTQLFQPLLGAPPNYGVDEASLAAINNFKFPGVFLSHFEHIQLVLFSYDSKRWHTNFIILSPFRTKAK